MPKLAGVPEIDGSVSESFIAEFVATFMLWLPWFWMKQPLRACVDAKARLPVIGNVSVVWFVPPVPVFKGTVVTCAGALGGFCAIACGDSSARPSAARN